MEPNKSAAIATEEGSFQRSPDGHFLNSFSASRRTPGAFGLLNFSHDGSSLSLTVSCTAVDDSEEIRGAEVSKGWQAVGPPRQSGGTIGRVIDYFSTKSVPVVVHAPAISARHYGCARFAAAH